MRRTCAGGQRHIIGSRYVLDVGYLVVALAHQLQKDDGSVALRIPGTGPHPIPFVVPSDTGNYVLALTKVPPGKKLVGCSECLTWDEFVELWSRVVGVKAVYEPCTIEEHTQAVPGGYTRMIGNMYEYATQFGYWGDGDPDVVFPEDVSFTQSVILFWALD